MMVAARCVGAAQRLVDEMTAFAKTREVGRQAARRVSARCRHVGRQRDRTVRRKTMLYEVARSIEPAMTARRCTGRPRWRSCTARRWPDASPTVPCRCSAAAVICVRTSPRGCSASSGPNDLGGGQRDPADHRGSSDDDPRTRGATGSLGGVRPDGLEGGRKDRSHTLRVSRTRRCRHRSHDNRAVRRDSRCAVRPRTSAACRRREGRHCAWLFGYGEEPLTPDARIVDDRFVADDRTVGKRGDCGLQV